MDDELRQGGVERVVLERAAARPPRARTSTPGCRSRRRRDERLRWIDRRHRVRSEPPNELGRQRARAAADVEDALTRGHPGEVRERGASGAEYLPMKRS